MGQVMDYPATPAQEAALAALFVVDGSADAANAQPAPGVLTELFSEDSAQADGEAEGATLQRAVKLGNLMVTMQENVASLQLQLEHAKADLLKLETEDLPELLKELSISSFTLEDGSSIEVKPDIQCGITEERRPAAHAWLVANEFGGLIKTDVVKSFSREERDEAVAFAAEVDGICKESVHPATLKSFIKEQMEAGNTVPADLFGIFPFNRAKLTRAKAKASKKSKS